MVRQDDRSVDDAVFFLRALTQDDWWVSMEDRIRVSSVAFFTYDKERREPGETSCYADSPEGRDVFKRRFPNMPAARFMAGSARAAGFNITRDPEGDVENSPEHFVLTYPRETRRNPYQRDCRQLALASDFTPSSSI